MIRKFTATFILTVLYIFMCKIKLEMILSGNKFDMSTSMPRLRILAEPKGSFRERYMCEGDPDRNRAQRFVRAEQQSDFVYPTIEIPKEWIDTLQLLIYIRVALVTVPYERVSVRYVHPYPINSEDISVMKDPATNSLYFPVSNEELQLGRKSFRFTQLKLTHYQLKNCGFLKPLKSSDNEEPLNDSTDIKRFIEHFQLRNSQLLFSIATFSNDAQTPVIYEISSVLSRVMIGDTTKTDDDDISFRCSPQRGDWQGGDEILMIIPKVKRKKAFTVRFMHPQIDQQSTINYEFVDAKTISFNTPPCPVPLTIGNPTASIPIVVTQSGLEIARVDFTYQSLGKCLSCNSDLALTSPRSPTGNKRPWTSFEEDDDD